MSRRRYRPKADKAVQRFGRTVSLSDRLLAIEEMDCELRGMFYKELRRLILIADDGDMSYAKAFQDRYYGLWQRMANANEGLRKHLKYLEDRYADREKAESVSGEWKPFVPKRDMIGTPVPEDDNKET